MTDAIAKAEQLAAERTKYASLQPDTLVPKSSALELAKSEYVAGYMTARTISAAELEAAARGLFLWGTEEHPEPRPTWRDLSEAQKGIWRSGARVAFRAAGLLIEGGE